MRNYNDALHCMQEKCRVNEGDGRSFAAGPRIPFHWKELETHMRALHLHT